MKRRNTPAKNEILNMFHEARTALSQDMIELQMKGSIDRVTIYRVLNSFCEDGLIHRVTVGNHLGQNYGRILSISDSSISLVEIIPDGLGGYLERPASVGLSD